MEDCCQEVKNWVSSNKLKLDDEKTEAILCGSKTLRKKVSVDAVCVGKSKIPLSFAVRNLGLIVDAGVVMQDYVGNSVRGCFYHLLSLGKLRPFLSSRAANTTAVSNVLSQLDHCDSCLWGGGVLVNNLNASN